MKLLTFSEALDRSDKEPHILLGNGFSIACKSDIFKYSALFNRADFKSLSPYIIDVFKALDTTDFEHVMKALHYSSKILKLYSSKNDKICAQFIKDAEGLKEVLVKAIAENHPEQPNDISDKQYTNCKKFLSNFNRIFTLNYDLLLYWTVMRDELKPKIACDDGFRTPEEGPQDYVTWEPENTHKQNIYYLHGALHIFDAQDEVQKYTWVNTGIRLIEQIREALNNNLFPLFVSEGENRQKLERIRHHEYLSKARRAFLSISGTLFIYGHSLDANDDHILKCISKNKVEQLFVSLYGEPSSDANKFIIKRTKEIVRKRLSRRPLQINFYDSSSAKVW